MNILYINRFFNQKDELFLNEAMAALWEESYVNTDPTMFESYKIRVAFMMRMVDNFGTAKFQDALKVLAFNFYFSNFEFKFVDNVVYF
jgi:hypothetical protein